jgi:hypothetical protein
MLECKYELAEARVGELLCMCDNESSFYGYNNMFGIPHKPAPL